MQDNQTINKARALYYNLFASFFVPSKELEKYLFLVSLVDILRKNPIDTQSGVALENIYASLGSTSNTKLLIEYDDLFHNPQTKKVRHTASYFDEGFESGKKRVEMINFVAKTKIRRDEMNFFEYEDSVGFLFTFMSELCDNIANGESEYENTVHCVFAQILNDFVDEFAKEVFEHPSSNIYKDLMIVFNSFIELERLFLEVPKPAKKVKVEKAASCEVEEISQEELERRARNKALKALGPKKEDESCPIDNISAAESDL